MAHWLRHDVASQADAMDVMQRVFDGRTHSWGDTERDTEPVLHGRRLEPKRSA